MAASVSGFDNFKLPAEFRAGDVVVHDRATKWRQVRRIGSGAFGSVYLQKNMNRGFEFIRRMTQGL